MKPGSPALIHTNKMKAIIDFSQYAPLALGPVDQHIHGQMTANAAKAAVAQLKTPAALTARWMKLKSPQKPMTTFNTSREIPATVEQVFAAISDPERLARWWGPDGFTNTSHVCEFKNGGRWSFTMHGPNGQNYPNECVFAEIEAPGKVVVDHVGEPKFRLTIALAVSAAGTVVSWSQAFESAEIANRIKHICVPANEQNLERLSAEVMRRPGSSASE